MNQLPEKCAAFLAALDEARASEFQLNDGDPCGDTRWAFEKRRSEAAKTLRSALLNFLGVGGLRSSPEKSGSIQVRPPGVSKKRRMKLQTPKRRRRVT